LNKNGTINRIKCYKKSNKNGINIKQQNKKSKNIEQEGYENLITIGFKI